MRAALSLQLLDFISIGLIFLLVTVLVRFKQLGTGVNG